MFRRPVKENPTFVKYWRKNPKSIEKYQFVYHFLPNPYKRTRATLLSTKAMFVYCALILALTGVSKLLPTVAPGVLGYASHISIEDLLKNTNQKRVEKGLKSLKINDTLSKAAQKKAEDMFANQYWAHISPSGKEPWDFILGEDYDYIYAGENLAKNYSTSKEVVEAWYKSPSHRDNLLNSNYDEIGFAVVNGVLDGYETTLVVQMFGKLRNSGQVASVNDIPGTNSAEERAEEVSVVPQKVEETVPVPDVAPQEVPALQAQPAFPTIIDVSSVAKGITLGFSMFISILLALDIWYTRRKSISKINGHTVAHLTLLLVIILSVWFFLKPGLVI